MCVHEIDVVTIVTVATFKRCFLVLLASVHCTNTEYSAEWNMHVDVIIEIKSLLTVWNSSSCVFPPPLVSWFCYTTTSGIEQLKLWAKLTRKSYVSCLLPFQQGWTAVLLSVVPVTRTKVDEEELVVTEVQSRHQLVCSSTKYLCMSKADGEELNR